jgi:hypothetical protein
VKKLCCVTCLSCSSPTLVSPIMAGEGVVKASELRTKTKLDLEKQAVRFSETTRETIRYIAVLAFHARPQAANYPVSRAAL